MSDEPATDASPADALPPKERFEQAAASKQSTGDDAETDLWTGSFSHLAMIGVWIGGAVGSVAAVVVGLLTPITLLWVIAAVAIAWVVMIGVYLYRRYSVHYTLTSQRLIHEAGLLWRTVDRVELIDVDDVTFVQGPVERLFGVGSVLITSSDRTTPELRLPGIDEVRDVADMIDDARRKERRSRGLHIEAV